jgi:IS30 family transposase
MVPRGKKHELGMLKMDEKTRILAWKEEGVPSEEIAKRLGRHRSSIELPQAHHASSQKGLWTSQKDEFDHEDDLEAKGS